MVFHSENYEILIEAVIGLAPNLLYGTGIPTAILIFNRDKQEDHRNKVLFINASTEYQNYLREEDVTHIITAYQAFQDEEGYAKNFFKSASRFT